jgi:tRNA/rRNA methyltransferase
MAKTEKTTIVLVEPEYDGNIGFCARAMKNFGIKKLALVNPKTDYLSGTAKARAMRAKNLLQKAKVFSSLEKALEGNDFSIATSAKVTHGKGIARTSVKLKDFAKEFSKNNSKTAIVFGSEKNGLTNKDLAKCDFLVTIPSSAEYPTLNLSHAVSIVCYELFQAKKHVKKKSCNERTKKELLKKFNSMVYAGKKIRNKENTLKAFKASISRAPITEKEAKAMLAVYDGILKRAKAKK